MCSSERVPLAGLTAEGYDVQPTKKKRSTRVDAQIRRMGSSLDRLVSHVVSQDINASDAELGLVKQSVSRIDSRLNQFASALDKIAESQTLLSEQLRKLQSVPTLFQNASLFDS